MDENTKTTYDIPEANLPKFLKQIEALSKRSIKLIGLPIEPLVFAYELRNVGGVEVKFYNVLLTAETPRLEGWTFVARLDHSQEIGNIIRQVPNVGELPAYFQTCAPNCQHCNVKRLRRDTFVLREDATGEYKQVGATCLKDFFGHDPYKIAKLAELLGYAHEAARGARELDAEQTLQDHRVIDVEEYCEIAAQIVLDKGWVSGKAAYENPRLKSTREEASSEWHGRHWGHGFEPMVISEGAKRLAADALAWARGLSAKGELNNYENNIRVIAEAVVMEHRAVGLAASIVGVFYQNWLRNQPKPQRVERTQLDSFQGVIDLMKRPGSKLKHPKIRLEVEGKPVVLSIAGEGSKTPGVVNVTDGGPFGNNVWYGRVRPNGSWEPSRSVNPNTMVSLTALLTALAVDPAKTAAEYGKRTGNCCWCNKRLDDARSLEVGYGPVCAKNYELPYPTAGQVKKALAA